MAQRVDELAKSLAEEASECEEQTSNLQGLRETLVRRKRRSEEASVRLSKAHDCLERLQGFVQGGALLSPRIQPGLSALSSACQLSDDSDDEGEKTLIASRRAEAHKELEAVREQVAQLRRDRAARREETQRHRLELERLAPRMEELRARLAARRARDEDAQALQTSMRPALLEEEEVEASQGELWHVEERPASTCSDAVSVRSRNPSTPSSSGSAVLDSLMGEGLLSGVRLAFLEDDLDGCGTTAAWGLDAELSRVDEAGSRSVVASPQDTSENVRRRAMGVLDLSYANGAIAGAVARGSQDADPDVMSVRSVGTDEDLVAAT